MTKFSKTTIEEWSDEWNKSDIEVSRYQDDEGVPTYSVRGHAVIPEDFRQMATWLTNLADSMPH